MAFDNKMAIVVVRSVKMGQGKLAAQVAHAAVTCALAATRYDKRAFESWMSEGQKKVVLRVDTTKDLYPLKQHAEDLGLTTALIQDAGHTQIAAGTVTCLGIGPGANADVDAVVGELKLL